MILGFRCPEDEEGFSELIVIIFMSMEVIFQIIGFDLIGIIFKCWLWFKFLLLKSCC